VDLQADLTQPLPLWPAHGGGARGVESDDTPRLTPYVLTDQQPQSAIVICPGGGYTRRAEHEGAPVARWLNSLGIAAFVLDYRVAPYQHPWPLRDAQRALRSIRHHAQAWRIDPQRLGVLGFSAGGHLAATLGTQYDQGSPHADDPIERQSCRPTLMVLCYPVITFGPYRHQGSMRSLLGDDPPPDLQRLLSIETQVTRQTPPAFIWHTADDASVPVQNSLLFAQALSDHQVPFELHVYPHGTHGAGLATHDPRLSSWPLLCATWLARLGFGSGVLPT
jgi:acetyl esterase/lipase